MASSNVNNNFTLFYSYVQKDAFLQERLENHLAILKYNGLISTWHNGQIMPGMERASEIDFRIITSDIILLLVSADYLASGYCYGYEMKHALEMHETGQARVIPIILRPVDWVDAPFSKLQVLPRGGRPVTNWRQYDDALTDIAKGIKITVLDLYAKRTTILNRERLSPPNFPNVVIPPSAEEPPLKLPGDSLPTPSTRIVPANPTPSFIPYSFSTYFEYTFDNQAKKAQESGINYKVQEGEINYYEIALEECNAALLISPGNVDLNYMKGWILQMLGRHSEAHACYSYACDLNPKMANAHYGAANALFNLGGKSNLLMALDFYERAFLVNPTNSFAHFSYGILPRRLGRIYESYIAFRRARDFNPDIDNDLYREWKHALNLRSKRFRWFHDIRN